jgi:transposase
MLGIPDINIKFPVVGWFSEETFNVRNQKRTCSIFNASLDYVPDFCDRCSKENNGKIIKWGSKTQYIPLLPYQGKRTYLKLNKRRFMCTHCGQTFMAKTPIIEKNRVISNSIRFKIAAYLQKKISLKDISDILEVSPSTVQRVMDEFYEEKKKNFDVLPRILCFDEFKSTKNVAAAMSFVILNGETNKVFDITMDRRLPSLLKYFGKFSPKARKSVEYIVMDMYQPYVSLVKELFPQAEIVFDRFHIVQHISRAFLYTRINIMNRLKKLGNEGQKKFRRLKRYWKLLQKRSDKLDEGTGYKRALFKNRVLNESEIVHRLLNYDEDLKYHYEIYQLLLTHLQDNREDLFFGLIDEVFNDVNYKFQTAFKTFRKYSRYVKNAITLPYHNGHTECFNNHSKVLKRIAYGYRNYFNFRKRILVVHGEMGISFN